MKQLVICLVALFVFSNNLNASTEKERIPDKRSWSNSNDRDTNSPQLYQDDLNAYVYSEKQLDNLTIGITDMMGNTYHYEVTTVPAGMYYAVSITSLPAGQYCLSIYQGSNYVIGIFQK